MFRFENLEVWRLAVDFGKDCYKVAATFPKSETFALADQLKRAAVSVSNNIAEGSVGSSANFRKYIVTSVGSTLESANILNFAYEVDYINKEDREDLYGKIEILVKKLQSLKNSLRN